jgi:hypothetical protein
MEKKLKEDFVKFLLDEYVYELFINSTDKYKKLAVEVIRHDAMERYDIELSDDDVEDIIKSIHSKIMYYYEK